MPSILGWLIAGMVLGPHALGLMSRAVLDSSWYKTIIMWMQCAFGVMLGTELFGTILFGVRIPIYLAFVFGGIALATAPAPAVSIVNEFRTKGSVTDTLLPMTVLDDVVGILVFFTVNSLVARQVSGGSVSLFMIPVMIFLPVIIGITIGFPTGILLKKAQERRRHWLYCLAELQ